MIQNIIAERYYAMLKHYVPQSALTKAQHARIVNLGCETALEAEGQVKYALEHLVGAEGKVHFTGIDVNSSALNVARRLPRDRFDTRAAYDFVEADARNLSIIFGNERFEAAFASHPHIRRDPWHGIFQATHRQLVDGGLLAVTSTHGYEMDEVLQILNAIGYKKLVGEENKVSGDQLASHTHRYVVVAQKQ